MARYRIDELHEGPLEVVGALDFDQRPDGVSPRRLPPWTRPQLPALMDVMVRMPSGVRLRFATDSRRIGLEHLATNLVTPPAERAPIVFNLESEGGLLRAESRAGNRIVLDRERPGTFRLERGEPDTAWFERGEEGLATCELWLPHNAFVELRALELEPGSRLQAAEPDRRPRWVHHGSSISHCMEAVDPALIWPAVAARGAGVSVQNLGFGGQCHLDPFVARTMRDSDADVLSIKTGINIINMDSMRERVFVPALHGFIDTLREGHPHTPLLLISPIHCPSAEHAPGPTVPNAAGRFVTIPGHAEIRNGCLTLHRVRELIAELVERRRAAGDRTLHYLDGTRLFGADDASDLPDDLHPSPEGYVRMGERFVPTLRALVD
jgi:hypothetical protein